MLCPCFGWRMTRVDDPEPPLRWYLCIGEAVLLCICIDPAELVEGDFRCRLA